MVLSLAMHPLRPMPAYQRSPGGAVGAVGGMVNGAVSEVLTSSNCEIDLDPYDHVDRSSSEDPNHNIGPMF